VKLERGTWERKSLKQPSATILEYAKKENLKSWGLALIFFFITAFVLFEVTLGILFGRGFGWLALLPLFLLGALAVAVFSGYIIAPMALSRGGVKEYVNPPQALVKMLDELSRKSGFRKPPKLMFQDTPEANAAAYHSILGKRIILTGGLVDLHRKGKITDEEMRSILAHELGHLKFSHILKRSFVLSWSSIFYFVGVVMIGAGVMMAYTSAASREEENRKGALVGIAIAAVGLIITVVSLIAKAIGFINLRRHEHEADAYSVAATGGTWLASALQKIERYNLALAKEATKRLSDGDSWTVRPRAGSWIERLFDTHPSTAKRIENIKALQTVPT
jgi:Zn-dependent protease with chaperone function